MILPSYVSKDAAFEVRKIELVGWSEWGKTYQYEVEIYYPERLYLTRYQMYGQDEMEVLARLYRAHQEKMKHMLREVY